jgi:putative transposase
MGGVRKKGYAVRIRPRHSSQCCPHNKRKDANMSRFKKMSHAIWFCEYHFVWCPKYRYRVLNGKIKEEVEICIRSQTLQQECEVVELNIQIDHVHLIVMIPPKVRVCDYVGRTKGKSALRVFSAFREIRQKKYWGNDFWSPGYCVGTVGLDEEQIRKYVRYQEEAERKQEEFRFGK